MMKKIICKTVLFTTIIFTSYSVCKASNYTNTSETTEVKSIADSIVQRDALEKNISSMGEKEKDEILQKNSSQFDVSKYKEAGNFLSYSKSTKRWTAPTHEEFVREILDEDKELFVFIGRYGSGGFPYYENIRKWIDWAQSGKLDKFEKDHEIITPLKNNDFSNLESWKKIYWDGTKGLLSLTLDENYEDNYMKLPIFSSNIFVYDGKLFGNGSSHWSVHMDGDGKGIETAEELQQLLPEVQIIKISAMDKNNVIKAKAKIPFVIINDTKDVFTNKYYLSNMKELFEDVVFVAEEPKRSVYGWDIYIDFE